MVVCKEAALAWIAEGAQPGCIVLLDPRVPRERVGMLADRHVVIVPLGPNVPGRREDRIELRRPWPHEFAEALAKAFGETERWRAEQIARECGGSLTVFLRRCAQMGAEHPHWVQRLADNANVRRAFVAALLAGRWRADHETDRKVVEGLARGLPYDAVEEHLRALTLWAVDEPAPVACLDTTWFVTAPIDAFELAQQLLTMDDIRRFIEVALNALTHKWFFEEESKDIEGFVSAQITGDLDQPLSEELLEGLTHTALFLAIRPPHDLRLQGIPAQIGILVRKVLTPERFEALSHPVWQTVLPLLAEAAPRDFLEGLGRVIDERPEVLRDLLGGDRYFGFLSGLELLAWDREHFDACCVLLARLAALDPGGRYANRPLESLVALFRPWFPQTHASFEQRRRALRSLIDMLGSRNEHGADIAWRLLEKMLPHDYDTAFETARPRLRMTVSVPRPTYTDVCRAYIDNLELALRHVGSDAERWKAILGVIPQYAPEVRERIFGVLERAVAQLSEAERQPLYRNLLGFLDHQEWRRACGEKTELTEEELERLTRLRDVLRPADPVRHNAFLFEKRWPPELARWSAEEPFERRRRAVEEVYRETGCEGILELLRVARTAGFDLVLQPFARIARSPGEYAKTVLSWADIFDERERYLREFSRAGVRAFGKEWESFLTDLVRARRLGERDEVAVLAGLPPSEWVLERIASMGPEARATFWLHGNISWARMEPGLIEPHLPEILALDRLLDQAAMFVREHVESLSTSTLLQFLERVAERNSAGGTLVSGVKMACRELERRLEAGRDVSEEPLLKLEERLIDHLTEACRIVGKPGKQPFICRKVAEDPAFFIELLRRSYRSEHTNATTMDPRDPERALNVLWACQMAPGTQRDGTLNGDRLWHWVEEVRRLAREVGHAEFEELVDEQVGQILAWAPADPEDRVWPHRAVRDMLDNLGSEALLRGLRVGRFNRIGAFWVAERKYRSEAERCREWAEKLDGICWPHTKRLLIDLAEAFEKEDEALWRDLERDRRLRLLR